MKVGKFKITLLVWGDRSICKVSKVLVLHSWRYHAKSLLCTLAIPDLRVRGRWVPGALWPDSLCYMASTEQQETCLGNEVDSTWHRRTESCLPACTLYVHAQPHTHENTHIQSLKIKDNLSFLREKMEGQLLSMSLENYSSLVRGSLTC